MSATPAAPRDFGELVSRPSPWLNGHGPHAGLVLSTREDPAFRDALVRLGITHMSAGSHTEPGGYAAPSDAEPQFEVSDDRSPRDVADALRAAGYDPVWKDWERV